MNKYKHLHDAHHYGCDSLTCISAQADNSNLVQHLRVTAAYFKPSKCHQPHNTDHSFGLTTHIDILKMPVFVRWDATADMGFTEKIRKKRQELNYTQNSVWWKKNVNRFFSKLSNKKWFIFHLQRCIFQSQLKQFLCCAFIIYVHIKQNINLWSCFDNHYAILALRHI